LTNGNGFVSVAVHGSEDVICEVVDCLVVDIMLNFQEAGGSVVGRVDGGVPDIF
jgi:hypothetical protein